MSNEAHWYTVDMRSSVFYAVLMVGIALMAAVAWFGLHHHAAGISPITATSSFTVPASVATSSADQSGLSIYTNGSYGFSIFYPGKYAATTTFDTQYHLPSTWRVFAPDNSDSLHSGIATASPLFQITRYSVTNTASYPRYFEAEVRIGISSIPADVSSCLQVSSGETALPDTQINGVSWKTFSIQNTGMMQYVKGTSYRTLHDKTCVALEQIETGSSYTDSVTNSQTIVQATLDQYYRDLDAVTKSFSFARP